MKCPYCDSEMERGYLQSKSPIIWCERKRHLAKIPTDPRDVGVSDGELTGFYAEAFYCRACNQMIVAPRNP